jgi:hypothetical protein
MVVSVGVVERGGTHRISRVETGEKVGKVGKLGESKTRMSSLSYSDLLMIRYQYMVKVPNSFGSGNPSPERFA